jgi:putative ABC transport system ATP-binding protein
MPESKPFECRQMVQVEQVGLVRHDRERGGSAILDNVSFNACEGRITAIVGPSGGGKSSLIRLINRLEDPTSGRILLDGADIADLDPLVLRQRVMMALQRPFMFPGTVLQNLQRPFLYRRVSLPSAGSPEVRDALELARLTPDLLERDARTLSVGQQQRVSIARGVIANPLVLLLDEPTSALDRPTGDQLAATLQDICRARQLTVLLVTHDLRLTGRIADDLIFMEAGRVRETGSAAELLANPETGEFKRFLAEPEEGGAA